MNEITALRKQVFMAILLLRLRDPDWCSLIETAIDAALDEEVKQPRHLRLVWSQAHASSC